MNFDILIRSLFSNVEGILIISFVVLMANGTKIELKRMIGLSVFTTVLLFYTIPEVGALGYVPIMIIFFKKATFISSVNLFKYGVVGLTVLFMANFFAMLIYLIASIEFKTLNIVASLVILCIEVLIYALIIIRKYFKKGEFKNVYCLDFF